MSQELVPHTNNHAEGIAQFLDANEQLQDPVQRRDYFEHLDENDFLDLTQQVAGLVRTGNAENQHFDGKKVGLLFHEVPDQREKERLLRDTWTVAKEFLSDPTIPDEDALDYAALTVAGGVLYAHPFADGNGRTSRTLSYMIARGNGDKQELHDILAETDGGKNWSVAPMRLVASGQSVFEGKQPKQIEWEWAFAGEADDALGGAIANSVYSDAIIRKFIEKHGDVVEKQIGESTSANEDGASVLDGQAFIANLVNDPEAGMTNARELLKIRREVRADYVHRFLKAMQTKQPIEPHRSMKSVSGEAPERIKENEFLSGVWRTVSAEIGKRAIDGLLTPADQQLIQHRAYSQIRHSQDQTQDVAA